MIRRVAVENLGHKHQHEGEGIKLPSAPDMLGMLGEVTKDVRLEMPGQIFLDLRERLADTGHPWPPCGEGVVETTIIAGGLLMRKSP